MVIRSHRALKGVLRTLAYMMTRWEPVGEFYQGETDLPYILKRTSDCYVESRQTVCSSSSYSSKCLFEYPARLRSIPQTTLSPSSLGGNPDSAGRASCQFRMIGLQSWYSGLFSSLQWQRYGLFRMMASKCSGVVVRLPPGPFSGYC